MFTSIKTSQNFLGLAHWQSACSTIEECEVYRFESCGRDLFTKCSYRASTYGDKKPTSRKKRPALVLRRLAPATGVSIDSMQAVDSDRVTPGDVHGKRDTLVKSLW